MKTMHEEYGDGSDHSVCEKCGYCKTCKDCTCNMTREELVLHYLSLNSEITRLKAKQEGMVLVSIERLLEVADLSEGMRFDMYDNRMFRAELREINHIVTAMIANAKEE